MRKNIMIVILTILLLGAAVLILKQNQTIRGYADGFDVTGTYTASMSSQTDYLIFTKEGKVCYYQPYGEMIKGTYKKTAYPNIYRLFLNRNSKEYIILGKNALTYIENDKLSSYVKLSAGEIYNNIEKP